MFGLDELKQTRFYQEVKLEGKLETLKELVKEGLTVEQISRVLKLSPERVEQEIQKIQRVSEEE